ncbi:MAG: flagellar basal body-associated FliL family protein [Halocynthiibacter sp.]
MSDEIDETNEAPAKASKRPLLIGLILAIVFGAGGFFVTYSGLLFGDTAPEEQVEETKPVSPLADVSFLPLDPMVINVSRSQKPMHLRFRAQLEVIPAYLDDVQTLQPRIIDILNGYLRAVPVQELEDPAALIKLRAQMLRRIQIVVGEGRVQDILIMEFVIN